MCIYYINLRPRLHCSGQFFLPVEAVYTEPCKFRYRSTVYTSPYTFLQCFFINGFNLHLVQVFTRVRVKVERYGTSQKF